MHLIYLFIEINIHAESEFLRVGFEEHFRAYISWKPTDCNEVLTFISLIIHTGTIRLNRLNFKR